MVYIRPQCLFGMAFLCLPAFTQAFSSPSESPSASSDLICPTQNASECYPRVFEPTKDFQIIKEGQDLPPGLHVRLNIWSGEREARLNIPMEGEEAEEAYKIEELPTERSVVVVDQPEQDSTEEHEEPALRNQVPMKVPVYESAGKIPPPVTDPASGDEMGTFQKALLTIKMEGRAFDTALDDLSDLAHDIYYGVEIAKDEPVLEKLVCLTLGSGTEKIPAGENQRSQKAASILGSALQNNPTALKEVSTSWKIVTYPTCGLELAENGSPGNRGNFVSMLRSRLGREKDVGALKAKIKAISNLIKEPLLRDEFIEKGLMELLLAIFLKKGEQFDGVRMKVTRLIMDNFLDEEMGAELSIWPKKKTVEDEKVCKSKESMLADGCWEYHVGAFADERPHEGWAREFLLALREQRGAGGSIPMSSREL